MKQIYGVILFGVILLAAVLLWPRVAPQVPSESGQRISTAALVSVSPPEKYEWVDRDAGVARIPIDRAIDILAEKGLPWGKVEEEPVASAASNKTGGGSPAESGLDPAMVQIGQALFTTYRCGGCHVEGAAFPQLAGKYGTRVNLEGGESALFDDDYIRESIVSPNAKVAAGYKANMPPYKDRITDDEINQIILYIRSLK